MLKLGAAKVDITPSEPIPLAGFSSRTGNFERVRHRIHARILCFELADEHKRPKRTLLISADWIWWGTDRVAAFKARIAQRYDVDTAAIVLHATHSHSGPQTSGRFTPSLGMPSEPYLATAEEDVLDGIAMAIAGMEPVTAERGEAACLFGVNRRLWRNGRLEMAPNREGDTDAACTVVRFRSLSGRSRAIMVHFTCHPTTTAANEISSEFPGIAMELLEQSERDHPTAVFLQGCCGDIRPSLVRDDDFYRGDENDVQRLASQLVDSTRDALRKTMRPLGVSPARITVLRLPLLYEAIPCLESLTALQREVGIAGEWAGALLGDPERMTVGPVLEMSWIAIAEGLSLLTFNAEMVVAYGNYVKRSFRGRVLPLAYTNGMIGYVSTEQQLVEGGYESRESARYFALASPFAHSTERRIVHAIAQLAAADS